MRRFVLEKSILNENDRRAAALRERFAASGVLCVNLLGSPGAGKTALLERTLERWPGSIRPALLTGDLATENDARRLARFGYPVRQICTAGACHLDASMVERALAEWGDGAFDVLFIENVGNLVCPTSFDLGESARVVVLSVAEGDDKPAKYPVTFARAGTMVLNKIDLLPHVPFDRLAVRECARSVNPDLEILETSCTTGAGLDAWMSWLADARRQGATRAPDGARTALSARGGRP
jgi:hydrogenase nickel incorporation protein HypB